MAKAGLEGGTGIPTWSCPEQLEGDPGERTALVGPTCPSRAVAVAGCNPVGPTRRTVCTGPRPGRHRGSTGARDGGGGYFRPSPDWRWSWQIRRLLP